MQTTLTSSAVGAKVLRACAIHAQDKSTLVGKFLWKTLPEIADQLQQGPMDDKALRERLERLLREP